MLNPEYEKHGYFVLKSFFSSDELIEVHQALKQFHDAWQVDNPDALANGVINSAWITGKKYLDAYHRLVLLKLVANQRLIDVLATLIPDKPAFMNTQLFFNPANPEQHNYWHRDIQYMPMSIAEQQAAINKVNVFHFRIPMLPEHGIELVPGSHARWDTNEELDVRLEQNGRHCYDNLVNAVAVPMQTGDLVVFSANMIHRGLYGLDRFAFDIIYCDSDPNLLEFVERDCLPDTHELSELETTEVFTNTRQAMAEAG